ncbi:MAG: hypothetical protein ACMXYC_04880 [Candidatus Woesearchaeota archaeon]
MEWYPHSYVPIDTSKPTCLYLMCPKKTPVLAYMEECDYDGCFITAQYPLLLVPHKQEVLQHTIEALQLDTQDVTRKLIIEDSGTYILSHVHKGVHWQTLSRRGNFYRGIQQHTLSAKKVREYISRTFKLHIPHWVDKSATTASSEYIEDLIEELT